MCFSNGCTAWGPGCDKVPKEYFFKGGRWNCRSFMGPMWVGKKGWRSSTAGIECCTRPERGTISAFPEEWLGPRRSPSAMGRLPTPQRGTKLLWLHQVLQTNLAGTLQKARVALGPRRHFGTTRQITALHTYHVRPWFNYKLFGKSKLASLPNILSCKLKFVTPIAGFRLGLCQNQRKYKKASPTQSLLVDSNLDNIAAKGSAKALLLGIVKLIIGEVPGIFHFWLRHILEWKHGQKNTSEFPPLPSLFLS